MTPEPDICTVCGAAIPQATFTQRGPFGIEMQCRQTLCTRCSFEHYLGRHKLRCPYKTPAFRYRADGQVPAVFIERMNHEKQEIAGQFNTGGPDHE